MKTPAIRTQKIVYLSEARKTQGQGITEEAQVILKAFEEFLEHHLEPISREWDDPVTRFLRLKNEWLQGTEFLSSIHEIILHPAYLQIIGMGPIVVPLIIDELHNSPDYWFWALSAITGTDPVTPEERGNIRLMTDAWLRWWRACGLRNEPVCKVAVS